MQLPLPPLEMRKLVGPVEDDAFDNPSGMLVYPYLDAAVFESVFDFGCGCGRVARQLIQQHPRPTRYVGIDLHLGMIRWCQQNLAPYAPSFEFLHHDVFNHHFNPGSSKPRTRPFPAADDSATLVNAFSVFTHLTQQQVPHYLREVARVLRRQGVFHSTWFLFDKREFPALQEGLNALYVSFIDPSAAVFFDRNWLRAEARAAGLVPTGAIPPDIRGYQWTLIMQPAGEGIKEIDIPPDRAPVGSIKLPDVPENPSKIGLDRFE
jgi:SAM-dependent methyltransferase